MFVGCCPPRETSGHLCTCKNVRRTLGMIGAQPWPRPCHSRQNDEPCVLHTLRLNASYSADDSQILHVWQHDVGIDSLYSANFAISAHYKYSQAKPSSRREITPAELSG